MNLSQVVSLSDTATVYLTIPGTTEPLKDEDGTAIGISLYNSKLPSKFKPFQREIIGLNACRDRELKLIDDKDKEADGKVLKIERKHYDRVQKEQAVFHNSLFVGLIGKLSVDEKPLTAENFSDALNRFDWLSLQVEAFWADSESFVKKPS